MNATLYFDNMTIYIDLVFLAQSDLALEIVQAIDNRAATVTTGVAISSVIIMVVFVMCPLLVKTVRGLTNDIQVTIYMYEAQKRVLMPLVYLAGITSKSY